MKDFAKTKPVASAAVVGAVYAALTMLLPMISYGPIQFRLSEALNVLPFFIPITSWGLFIGCAVANLFSAAGLPDIIFGSIATLLSALCVSRLGKNWRENGAIFPELGISLTACAMPVLFNGPIIGAVLSYTYTPENFWQGLCIMGSQVALGEAAVMLAIGLPLMRILPKMQQLRGL